MIYVDALFATKPTPKWPYLKACHLFGDNHEELHAFAHRLGLKREWFQDHHSNPRMHHYDLTISKRSLAVVRGAQEIASIEEYKKLWEKKDENDEQHLFL
jgi:alkanesulfonate monooxygenase SsuD/methylene tetrahydromethanopterin reductase-like flavin-dependent oxidoreductase (luciferase family)